MTSYIKHFLLALIFINYYCTLFAQTPGTQKWVFTTSGEVASSAAIDADGVIYVGSNDDNLYAINPDGSQKWAFKTDYLVDSSPAVGADGVVYVGSRGGNLYAINPDGSQKWAFKTGQVYSSPAISVDGVIYVGSYDHKLYAIKPDGSQKWVFTTGRAVCSSPAIGADGVIYVGSLDQKLYAINPDASQKWAFKTDGYINSSPAIGADGVIYVGSGFNLYAINPDGSQKWNFTTGGSIDYSSPAIGIDGVIYVGSDKLYAINPDGSQKWVFTTGGHFDSSSPAIGADGVIYVGSHYQNLYAINPDGSQKWVFNIGWLVHSSPAIGADGVIYMGSSDNKLNAIYSSSSGLADSPWPKFRQNKFNRGCYPCMSISDEMKFNFIIDPGANMNHVFTIGNSFSEDVTVSLISFSNASFSLTSSLPQVIASGASKTFTASISITATTSGRLQSNCNLTYQKADQTKTITDSLAGAGIFFDDGSELSVIAHRAIIDYDICRAKNVNSPATFNNLGVLYRLLGEPVLAERYISNALSKALNAEYGYSGIKMNLGVIGSDRRQYTEANSYYSDALKDVSTGSPLAAQVYYNQAWQAYAADSFAVALSHINNTLASNQINQFLKAKAYVLSGAIRYRSGQKDQAIADFEKAIVNDPDGPIGRMAQENINAIRTGVFDDPILLPQEFEVMPNYPNPFNPETTIKFGLPHPAQVQMLIYNIIGQKICTLLAGRIAAGWHEVKWDGKNERGQGVISGIYLLRIKADQWEQVQKLMLVR